MRYRNRQSGFSLIEVLVATVILAVGILGIAGLQVVSLQQNRSALLRSEGLQIGSDILDRMRANPTEDYSGIAFGDEPPAAEDCNDPAANCTTAEMMEFDQAIWLCSIDPVDPDDGTIFPICTTLGVTVGALPGGEGRITVDADGVHEVAVRWVDDGDGNFGNIRLRTRAD